MQCEYLLTNGLSWGWWLVQRSVTLAVKYHTTTVTHKLVVKNKQWITLDTVTRTSSVVDQTIH